jgi:hypothetical protein
MRLIPVDYDPIVPPIVLYDDAVGYLQCILLVVGYEDIMAFICLP